MSNTSDPLMAMLMQSLQQGSLMSQYQMQQPIKTGYPQPNPMAEFMRSLGDGGQNGQSAAASFRSTFDPSAGSGQVKLGDISMQGGGIDPKTGIPISPTSVNSAPNTIIQQPQNQAISALSNIFGAQNLGQGLGGMKALAGK